MADEGFELGGGYAFGAGEGYNGFAGAAAVGKGGLKSGMVLVGPYYQYVEIYLSDKVGDVAVDLYGIYIADSTHHIASLFGGADGAGSGFELFYNVGVLHGHNQTVAHGARLSKQLHVADVEQVVDANSQYFFIRRDAIFIHVW